VGEPARVPARTPQSRPRHRARKRHHVGFLVFAGALIGAMVLGLVSMNALLAQTSFRIDDLQGRIDALAQANVRLTSEQARLSAPGRIAEWARRNGMRLPDDIRSLHAPTGPSAPAGDADTSLTNPPTPGAEDEQR
jgi:cell division protein FtsL